MSNTSAEYTEAFDGGNGWLSFLQELNTKARNVLFARENHSEKTLAEMYDPDKMPEDLREAHAELDLAVDRLYRQKPYNSDEERLTGLFALYEQMTNTEKETK